MPAVSYVEAVEKDVTPSFKFVGRAEAVQRVDLRARVTGFLERQLFEDGAEVQAGDLLFMIEQATFAAQVQWVEANLQAAQADEENARVQFERAEQLVKNGNIPRATVDERRAAYLVAQASVAQAQAALEQDRITYDYTAIVSPIDGRIGRAAVKTGNLVSTETGVLATVVKRDPIYISFNVAEKALLALRRMVAADQLGTAREGLGYVNLRVRLSDDTLYDAVGSLDFSDVQVDATTDTIAMRGTIPNPDGILVDGQVVIAQLELKEPETALVIPRTAVSVDQRGSFVMLVGAEDTVEQRVVTMGQQFGTDVAIKDGLKPGDRVITDGLLKVRAGIKVSATPQAGS